MKAQIKLINLNNIKSYLNHINLDAKTLEMMALYIINYEKSRLNNTNFIESHYNEEIDMSYLLNHIVGFVDGDGSFRSGRRDKGTRYAPNISLNLHKDDNEYLNYLNIVLKLQTKIYYSKNRDDCTLLVSNPLVLKNIIIPIFDKYPLLGAKAKDYQIWKEVVNTWQDNNLSKAEKLTLCDKHITYLNKNTELHTPQYEHVIKNITIPYIIGFIEAEGHLGIPQRSKTKMFSPCLEIGQHINSKELIRAIQDNILNWTPNENLTYELPLVTNNLYKDQNKYKFKISNIDRLYYQVVPTILNHGLYTRKYIDFVMWMTSIIIIKHGLHLTDNGKLLLKDMKLCINNKRYLQKNQLVPLSRILDVLSMIPLYDPSKPKSINKIYKSSKKL